jgi:hypothetical protein
MKMKKELLKKLTNAIFALLLIALIKIVAAVMLKHVVDANFYLEIVLSLAVVIVLLKFMQEFNHQLVISSPAYPQVRSIVKGIIFLFVILTLYGTFGFLSGLPYNLYHIFFFLVTLIPVYYLWNILYRNSDMLTDILRNVFSEEIIACSCGWKNDISSRFCSKCGLELSNVQNNRQKNNML